MAQVQELISDNFLHYASYVVRERAIPDLVDGLKPVQRRILYTLFELDDGRFHKVSNVVGHCMRYHPHGEASIYSALVNLSHRGGLIETQGNFGNPLTGDQASAPRYIECRITPLAKEILLRPRLTRYEESYDGRGKEPVSFPATIPLVLLLGVEGIAVGMATSILPHNFHEVIDAMIASLKKKRVKLYPDFPSGGAVDVGEYEDGSGKVRVRAKLDVVGNKSIVIRELPYGRTTESLVRSVESAVKKHKLPISEIQDYTAEHIEIELKASRGVDARTVLDRLYAFTDCEISHTVNFLVIEDGLPTLKKVQDVISSHTNRLCGLLEQELRLLLSDAEKEYAMRTLERIFIEERIYRDIEEQPDMESIHGIVRKRFQPFLKRRLVLEEDDITTLLRIPVRKISRYDREKAEEELQKLREKIADITASLADIPAYTISYLQGIVASSSFPARRTRVEQFDKVHAREVAARNLALFYDKEKGFLGIKVPSGARVLLISEFDRVLIIRKDGSYVVAGVPERLFVGDTLLHVRVADKEVLSRTVFNVLYQNDEKQVYLKRSRIEQFIIDKPYTLIPKGSKLLAFSTADTATITLRFVKKPRMKVLSWKAPVSDYAVKGLRSAGVRLSTKAVRKASLK